MKTKAAKYFTLKIFRVIFGFLILLLIQFVSEKILHTLGLNFPPTILGLIIFALLLNFKIIPMWFMKDICIAAISILPALFVPLLVGITAYWGIIKQNLIGIIGIIILATFITMVSTAIFVDKIMEWTGKKNV